VVVLLARVAARVCVLCFVVCVGERGLTGAKNRAVFLRSAGVNKCFPALYIYSEFDGFVVVSGVYVQFRFTCVGCSMLENI